MGPVPIGKQRIPEIKTANWKIMNKIIISILIFISGEISAQECKIDLYSLARPDINMTQLKKFGLSRIFKVVLSNGFNATENKEIIDQLSNWFLNQNSRVDIVNIKDVKTLDDSCHYLIIGLTSQLKDLSIFDLPVKVYNNKCSLGPIELSNCDDAITLINEKAQCSAVIGNSYEALRSITIGRFTGLYDYYVLKNNKMAYLGNLQENRFFPIVLWI